MILKFVTNRDSSGNRYTLIIDTENKTYKTDYNLINYDNFITISKREKNKLIKQLDTVGYIDNFYL